MKRIVGLILFFVLVVSDNETAVIISNQESEGYGRLDRENTQNLKNVLAD